MAHSPSPRRVPWILITPNPEYLPEANRSLRAALRSSEHPKSMADFTPGSRLPAKVEFQPRNMLRKPRRLHLAWPESFLTGDKAIRGVTGSRQSTGHDAQRSLPPDPSHSAGLRVVRRSNRSKRQPQIAQRRYAAMHTHVYDSEGAARGGSRRPRPTALPQCLG